MNSTRIYDVAILGGGPAGCAGAVYAARKKLSTALITETFGGQSTVSDTIYNWIGTPQLSGIALANSLESHVRAYPDDVTIYQSRITELHNGEHFTVVLANGEHVHAHTVLYTLGSNRRKLEAINADIFEHKGLTYCASCDGPVFAGQDVVVVGGGNAGFESALQLLAYCNSVTLLHRSDSFRADEITVNAALSNPKFKAIKNVTIHEVSGNTFVSGIRYSTLEETNITLPVAGIFVEIGQLPNTDLLRSLANHTATPILDNAGHVITDPRTGTTALPRLWAAGDCTDCLYHQNNIAAGDAVRALEDLYIWISKNR
jgi:alkyl hydroperoxide reductase subunit F